MSVVLRVGLAAELLNSLAHPAGDKHTVLHHNAHLSWPHFKSQLAVTQSFVRVLDQNCLRVMLRPSENQRAGMAIKHALTRKGYWRLSRTPGLQIAMPNNWLHEQGLLSLKQLWCDLAPLRGTA